MPKKASKGRKYAPKNSLLAAIAPVTEFANNSISFIRNCKYPEAKEFVQTANATTVGFLAMGFIGFFVKLIHIPINNIIVGSQ